MCSNFIGIKSGTVEVRLAANADILTLLQKGDIDAALVPELQITELTKKSISKDVLDAAFKRLTVTNDPEKDSVLDFVKSSVKEGFLKTEPDALDLFNLTILNKVLKAKGLAEIK